MTDTYTYRSVTGGHIVTWTRDDHGTWHADDGRGDTATDADIEEARAATDDELEWEAADPPHPRHHHNQPR